MYSVLIVDDERMIRNGLRDLIPWQSLGVSRVRTAASAQQAFAALEEEPADILLTDICMPETTGIEMVRQLENRQPQLRTIVLTGYNDFEYAKECCRIPVHDFLLKPINEEELVASVREQIAEVERWRARQHKDKVKSRAEEMSAAMRLEWALRGLAHGELPLPKAQDILARYNYDPHCPVQIALVLPHLPQGRPEESELRLLTIKHICLEMVDSRQLGITFEDSDGKLGLVFFAGDDFSDAYSQLEQLAGRLRDEIGAAPRMILGSSVDGLGQLQISYNDALHLLREMPAHHGGAIHHTKGVEKRMQAFYTAFESCKMLLCSNLADEENLTHAVDMLEELFRQYNLSLPFLRRCCFEVAAGAYFTFLQENGGEANDQLAKTLELVRTAQRENVLDLTRSFLLRLFPRDDRTDNQIIHNAKQYINEHLSTELSVSSVAAHLYINANYFSRLFKQTAGEGCSEYITRKRMERAKALLENSSLKTGQVAEEVGYKDKNYFSLAFKKHTGLAPTAYRSKAWAASARSAP